MIELDWNGDEDGDGVDDGNNDCDNDDDGVHSGGDGAVMLSHVDMWAVVLLGTRRSLIRIS